MKQWEAVVLALEQLGGQATLAELYPAVMHIEGCLWRTRTPFASIRRILQTRPEFVRIRPGLWALSKRTHSPRYQTTASIHSYYQGILVAIGNWYGMNTYVPASDRNKSFINSQLDKLCTVRKVPPCSYPRLVNIIARIDVVWFNHRGMPERFFEVEHTTDFHRSLLKFAELQDFAARMVIVADQRRRQEFERSIRLESFASIRERVQFLDYDRLVKMYEAEAQKALLGVSI